MKTRCIDKITIPIDFIYFRSLSYIANYKDQKRRLDNNAEIKHIFRKNLSTNSEFVMIKMLIFRAFSILSSNIYSVHQLLLIRKTLKFNFAFLYFSLLSNAWNFTESIVLTKYAYFLRVHILAFTFDIYANIFPLCFFFTFKNFKTHKNS